MATASVGSTVNLAETLGVSNVGSYTASLACTAGGSPLTVTGNTITMPNAAVTCTFTNTGVTNAVTVIKDLAGFNDPGLFNLLVNGTVVAPNVGDGGQGTSGNDQRRHHGNGDGNRGNRHHSRQLHVIARLRSGGLPLTVPANSRCRRRPSPARSPIRG